MPDPGWYNDPQDPTSEEYWDGQSWSGRRRPSTGPQSSYDDQQTSVQSSYGGYAPTPAPPAGYGQPSYGQPGYSTPSYGQPGYSQPSYGQPGYSAQSYGQPGYVQPPAAATSRKKLPLIIAGVVVVLVAAAAVTFFLVSGGSSPTITYDGKQIASADTVLTRAETAVDSLVTKQHGTKNSSTRCYFVQPTKPAQGAKSSDIIDSLRCGPVLFVDGQKSAEYLTVPITASTSGSPVHVTTDTSSLTDTAPAAVPEDLKLVRPDGESPPSGNGGLSVPQPPAAARDALVAATLGINTPKAVKDATMVGKDQDVTLIAAGEVKAYGSGVDARSAPRGQRLIAFQIEGGVGAVGNGGTAQPKLVVDGKARSIPDASGDEWDVAAVPTGSSPVIQLKADGFTQTLSLPDGTPGAHNIAVLQRKHTTGLIGKEFDIPTTYSKGSQSLKARLTVSAPNANLYFWVPNHPGAHPASAGSAYLAINLTYLDTSTPGKAFGFDTSELTLKLPDGTAVHPKNVASGTRIFNVFTVPADYTSGTLHIGGGTVLDDGITQTLNKSKSFQVHIRAN